MNYCIISTSLLWLFVNKKNLHIYLFIIAHCVRETHDGSAYHVMCRESH